MRNLDKIAKYYGTDKSSNIHNYCEKYEKWFPFERLEPIKILEIGVLDGKSLLTWREFYPNAIIIGIDVNNDCKQYEDVTNNIYVEIGSQYDSHFLNEICKKYGSFDLVLDDGSHIQKHMIFSFEQIFPSLKSEGIYVVEDTVTSYWEEVYEGGFRKKGTCIEYFKELIDDVNFHGHFQQSFHSVHARREDLLIPQIKKNNPEIRVDIESINFLNSIIIITKR